MEWMLKKFDELALHELYAILQLRNEVFAVEQNCVYPDMDNKDQLSFHLTGRENDKLMAYTRIIPPGVVYEEPSIGRVVTAPAARGAGAGRELMERSIQAAYKLFGKTPIRIGAQLYLHSFYSSLGFQQTGDVYPEDGIEHIEMILY
ncbi:MAG: GNAT family N-acetyltransferase [Bacteroidota bacterium]